MLYSYFEPFFEVMNDPRKPQGSKLSASVHGFDTTVRLTVVPDPVYGIVFSGVTITDGVAAATGTDAGRAMTRVETICSILSRPSKIGVCARL
jgi:hypothetical protein